MYKYEYERGTDESRFVLQRSTNLSAFSNINRSVTMTSNTQSFVNLIFTVFKLSVGKIKGKKYILNNLQLINNQLFYLLLKMQRKLIAINIGNTNKYTLLRSMMVLIWYL